MTRRRMTITIELQDRPAYADARDLALDLLGEAALADGWWQESSAAEVVGARWLDTPRAGACMDAAKALWTYVTRWDPDASRWEEMSARSRDGLAKAVQEAVEAGEIELPEKPPGKRALAAWIELARSMGMIPDDQTGEIDRAGDLLMTAWAVIANAHVPELLERMASGGYGPERTEWAQAALRFRDGFHAWLADHPGKANPVPDCGAVSRAGTVCYRSSSEAHDEHEGQFPAVVEVHDAVQGDVRLKPLHLVERWS